MAQYHFPPIDMLNESRDVSTFTDIRYVEELKQKLNYMFAIEGCRGDDWNCMHSAHAIRALEAIRDILVPAGVPVKYFEL